MMQTKASGARNKGEHFAPKQERGKHRPPRKPPASKGTIVFRVVFLTIVVLLTAAIIVGLNVLWGFLEEYEQSLPEKAVDIVIARLEQGDTDAVYESCGFTPNEYEDDSAAREYAAGLFRGELSYTKDVKQSTDDLPVYAIKCDGKRVCSLSLKKTGEKTGWGFPLYEAADFSGVEIPTSEITITAPDNALIYINGKLAEPEPVSSKAMAECEHFYGYIDKAPAMAEYTFGGFTAMPEVKAARPDGSQLLGSAESGKFSFTPDGGEIPQELSDLAVKASQTYSKFISADAAFSAVAAYIPEDVPLYENIRTYEARFYTPHSDYDFLDVNVRDFRRYTADCVSLTVTYTQRIYAGYLGDFDFPTDNTIYLAKTGEEWVVTDIVMN